MLPLSDQIAPQILALQKAYNAQGRHYHTWQHVTAMLGHFENVEDLFHHPDMVALAIYYHDAIYDPLAKDNEAQSARLCIRELHEIFDEAIIRDAANLIHATAGHELPDMHFFDMGKTSQEDCAMFLDIDLSILGQSPSVYAQYEKDIRREYAMIPEAMFNAGRAQILQNFLDRERLYFSDIFAEQWEDQARQNVTQAIKKLTSS